MKNTFLTTVFTFIVFSFTYAENNSWIKQKISGSVEVYFPKQAQKTDTANQVIYYLQDGDDYMLASLSPLPSDVNNDGITQDSLLNQYIRNTIENANVLIYSNVDFKGIQGKFYKVRMDDPDSYIKGLIVDSYNIIYQDTIYTFSYFRYNAKELYDYKKQKKFFDRIEIGANIHSHEESTEGVEIKSNEQLNEKTTMNHHNKWISIALGLSIIIIIILVIRIVQLKK